MITNVESWTGHNRLHRPQPIPNFLAHKPVHERYLLPELRQQRYRSVLSVHSAHHRGRRSRGPRLPLPQEEAWRGWPRRQDPENEIIKAGRSTGPDSFSLSFDTDPHDVRASIADLNTYHLCSSSMCTYYST